MTQRSHSEAYSLRKPKLKKTHVLCVLFTAALLAIARTWKQPRCPLTDEWIWKKLWYVYTMEYYSAIKKKEIISVAAPCMHLESVILSKVSQTEKEKYCMTSLICGI